MNLYSSSDGVRCCNELDVTFKHWMAKLTLWQRTRVLCVFNAISKLLKIDLRHHALTTNFSFFLFIVIWDCYCTMDGYRLEQRSIDLDTLLCSISARIKHTLYETTFRVEMVIGFFVRLSSTDGNLLIRFWSCVTINNLLLNTHGLAIVMLMDLHGDYERLVYPRA